MAQIDPFAALRAFNTGGGYEILDDDLVSRGEVVIRSASGFMMPCLGGGFTVDSDGHVQDVTVCELIRFDGGGWSARCKVQGWV